MEQLRQPIVSDMIGTEVERRYTTYVNGVAKPDPENHAGQSCIAVMRHISKRSWPLAGGWSTDMYLENGGRRYWDNGVEEATAECSTPKELCAQLRANEENAIAGLETYAHQRSRHSKLPVVIVLQRRVIDSEGHTWACHDNVSVADQNFLQRADIGSEPQENWKPTTTEQKLLKAFLITRPYITGAGYVNTEGVHFAQKMSVEHEYTSYRYAPSLLRATTEDGGRLEVRCSDNNLRDWAMLSRIGDLVLFAAAAQTGLAKKLLRQASRLRYPQQAYNLITDGRSMQYGDNPAVTAAVDFQRFTQDLILNNLHKYSDRPIPEDYRQINEASLQYSDEFMRFWSGKDHDLRPIADRPDWAAKLRVQEASVRREGGERNLLDDKSIALDLLYDRVEVTSADGKTWTSYGYGQKLADQHRLVDQAAVERHKRLPPASTRASDRVRLAQQPNALGVSSWDSVQLARKNGSSLRYKIGSNYSKAERERRRKQPNPGDK